jgi:hypothetical protein
MTTTAIQNFIIETTLVDPITDIVTKLENKEFRDCDIKWLNNRLHNFTTIAMETLGKSFGKIDLVDNDGVMNEYKTNRFLEAFNTILNYFKTF